MNSLDAGLYGALAGDTGAGGVATIVGVDRDNIKKIYQLDAPPKTDPSYVLFQEAQDIPGYTFGNTNVFDHTFYMVRAFCVDANTTGPAQAGVLADRCKALLTNPALGVSGKTVLSARVDRTYPPLKEWDSANNRFIYSRGVLVEIWVS